MKRVAIVGYGHVGKALHKIFPDAVIYDRHLENYQDSRDEVNKCDMAIVSVPTPEDEVNNKLDCSIVEEVVEWLQTPLILLKSTVSVGFTDAMCEKYHKRICMSPEYYGES